MKKKLFIILMYPLILQAQIPDISGSWSGQLEFLGTRLSIIFNIFYQNGHLWSTLDSPDQGAFGIRMDSTWFNGKALKITSGMLMGQYEGIISDSLNSFSGVWEQAGMKFSLTLRQTDAVKKPARPQHPLPPYPYEVKEVSFRNEADGITLCGTFTYPSQKEAFPAVVLISGSGKQNRDEEIMGHKPFLVIADYLTRNGIGVLRFDDRGEGCSEGDFASATSESFSRDVLAAVSFLKAQNNVIKDRIGLIGHSEGGMIAPMVAAVDHDISFIILLAGPGTNGMEIILDQTELILRSNAVGEEEIKRKIKANREIFEMVLHSKDIPKTQSRIANKIFKQLKQETSGEISDDLLRRQADIQAEMVCSPWFRFFLNYDPAIALSKLKCHVLALNGSLDLQVPADKNLSAIEKILRESGNQTYTIKKFEGLNHLFQHATTGNPAEYVKIEETFAQEVLEYIKDWITTIIKYH